MQPKLRLVYYEDEDIASYLYLEKSEGLRVIEILKILPQLKDWTPIYEVSAKLHMPVSSLLRTIHKIAGAEKVDLLINGERKVIKRYPVLFMKKEGATDKKPRPPVYIKSGVTSKEAKNLLEIHNAYSQIRKDNNDALLEP